VTGVQTCALPIYGYRLSKNIGKLTDAADRISVGELDVVIEIKSSDEIGALAEAISRMQDSLRFSIERLRRRR
jgi:HAMP domain-containing protein